MMRRRETRPTGDRTPHRRTGLRIGSALMLGLVLIPGTGAWASSWTARPPAPPGPAAAAQFDLQALPPEEMVRRLQEIERSLAQAEQELERIRQQLLDGNTAVENAAQNALALNRYFQAMAQRATSCIDLEAEANQLRGNPLWGRFNQRVLECKAEVSRDLLHKDQYDAVLSELNGVVREIERALGFLEQDRNSRVEEIDTNRAHRDVLERFLETLRDADRFYDNFPETDDGV